MFIAESAAPTLEMHPVLKVADAESFDPAGALEYVETFDVGSMNTRRPRSWRSA